MSNSAAAVETPRSRLAIGLLTIICLASVLAVVLLGTRLTFFNDDWYFLLQRPGLESHGGLDSLLAPHNSQSVLLTVLAYKILVALFGLGSQLAFRLVLGIAIAAVGVFVYLLVSARTGPLIGLASAMVILFLGSAWEDLLFFASLDLVGSLATGLAAIWALQRDSGRRNLAACVLLTGSVAFSNLGVAFLVAGAVAVAVRKRAVELWLAIVPAALFVLWWAIYGHRDPSHISAGNLEHLPRYVLQSAAYGLASLTGLYRGSLSASLTRGYVVLALAAGLIVVCLPRGWRPRLTVLVPASGLLTFWCLSGAAYFPGRDPSSSRYQLIDAALLIIIAAELYRPSRLHRPVTALVVVATVAVVASNVDGGLRYGYRFLRTQSSFVKADLAALELSPGLTPRDLWLTAPIARNPYLSGVTAGRFFAETAAHGKPPTYSIGQLILAPADQRQAADSVLVRAERMLPVSTRAPAIIKPGCSRVIGRAELTLHPGNWRLTDAGRSGLAIGLRRFAPPGEPTYVALLGPGSSERLTIPADRTTLPWRLSTRAGLAVPLEVCPL